MRDRIRKDLEAALRLLISSWILKRIAALGSGSQRSSNGAVTPAASGQPTPRKPRLSPARLFAVVAVGAVIGILATLVVAAYITGVPKTPPLPGTARVLISSAEISEPAQIMLQLILERPDSRYVEYRITTGCGTRLPTESLMLSGAARIAIRQVFLSTGLRAAVRTERVGEPWFSSPEQIQLITLPVKAEPCPPGEPPRSFGTAAAVQGFVNHSFENSVVAEHSLQLPQVGDQTHSVAFLPTEAGEFAAPLHVDVQIAAGALPLDDQIDVARPQLSNSGGLTWKGQGYVIASASWTDSRKAHLVQFLLFTLGAFVGVLGSLLVAVGLEWLRASRPDAPSA